MLNSESSSKMKTLPHKPSCTEIEVEFSSEGFPMFPPQEGIITTELVKNLEDEEFGATPNLQKRESAPRS